MGRTLKRGVDVYMTHVDKIFSRMFKAVEIIKLDERLLVFLTSFKNKWESDIVVRMGNGQRQKFNVMRFWHKSPFTDSPYKGGMRYHPDINSDMMKSHAVEMSLKCWIAGIPFGGAKGGIDVNPSKHSLQELKDITEAAVKELVDRNIMGPYLDVLAPDMGTNPQVMNWIRQSYAFNQRTRENSAFVGVVTGKPVDQDFHYGGVKGRLPATGYGLVKVLDKVLELKKIDKASMSKVAIMGFGNVGRFAAKYLSLSGYKIVAVSDFEGGIYYENGLDNSTLENIKSPQESDHGDKITNEEMLELDVDVLVPAAIENVITENNADKVKARCIVEGANGPTTPEADTILDDKGVIIIPDILANAGGVSVSFFEWARNTGTNDERLPVAQKSILSEDEVLNKLTKIMHKSAQEVLRCSEEYKVSMRMASYIFALKRIEPLLREKYYV